jgi:hypothetical protein
MSDLSPESAPKQTLIACQTYGEGKSGTSLSQSRKRALSASRCLSSGPPATNEQILENELPSRHYRVLLSNHCCSTPQLATVAWVRQPAR